MRKLQKNPFPITAKLSLAILVLAMASSCAKFPDNPSNQITKRLVFTIKFASAVRYGQSQGQQPYVYIIPLRLSTESNPTDLGPIPVTSFGGNGFVAGHCTHYIVFNPASSNPYEIWQFSDEQLNNRFQTGLALNYLDPRSGGNPNTLQFEIDMSQLVPAADVNTIQSVQMNLFAMDKLALDQSGHIWDSLGDGRIASQDNTYLTFQLKNSRKITNTTTNLEPPTADFRNGGDPSLDIRDWSVNIQLQQ